MSVFGISIGIATIITLNLVTSGLKENIKGILKAGAADFVVGQANTADWNFSSVDEEVVEDLLSWEEIESATGVLFRVVPTEENPYFVMMGLKKEILAESELSGVNIIEGQAYEEMSEDQLILGKIAADNYNKKVSDTMNIAGKDYQVRGIFETGNTTQDGGAFLSLDTVQKLIDSEGKVSIILVKLSKDADLNEVTENVDDKYQGELVTIKSVDEFSKVNRSLDVVNAASWIISLLAVVVGGIGVANTIMMSVFERTHEIGVLRAVGWRRSRVLFMILLESFLVGTFALVIGTALGVAALKIILLLPAAQSFVEPVYSFEVFIQAFLIAMLVALVGGVYPAVRAANLSPTEAIRHE